MAGCCACLRSLRQTLVGLVKRMLQSLSDAFSSCGSQDPPCHDLDELDEFDFDMDLFSFDNDDDTVDVLCNLDKEISNRIAKASASYGRLHKRVWNERGLKLETKCAVYRAVVLTALLYGCESWTVYRRHVKLLDQFHQRCLRRILNIKWYHRVSNVKVLLQAQMPSIDALLTQSQLRWSGHLVRMLDSRLPKQLCYGELTGGHRPRGRPKLRYKDTLKKSLQKCDIDEKRWEFLATNRSEWRQAIRKGTEAYENERQVS
ncbi:hypothetical protein ACOMHN_058268 [Nucella lapillus]